MKFTKSKKQKAKSKKISEYIVGETTLKPSPNKYGYGLQSIEHERTSKFSHSFY